MVDFRSRGERDAAHTAQRSEDADYKRMYQDARADNQALHAKLDVITANHGELLAQFADLLSQFETLKATSQERSEDLLKIARNMENMVATAYEQQGDVLSKFKADITERLGAAKASLGDLEDGS